MYPGLREPLAKISHAARADFPGGNAGELWSTASSVSCRCRTRRISSRVMTTGRTVDQLPGEHSCGAEGLKCAPQTGNGRSGLRGVPPEARPRIGVSEAHPACIAGQHPRGPAAQEERKAVSENPAGCVEVKRRGRRRVGRRSRSAHWPLQIASVKSRSSVRLKPEDSEIWSRFVCQRWNHPELGRDSDRSRVSAFRQSRVVVGRSGI